MASAARQRHVPSAQLENEADKLNKQKTAWREPSRSFRNAYKRRRHHAAGARANRNRAARGGVGSLLDEAVARPETLRVAVAGIHEFDVVANHAHDAEIGVLGCRQTLIA